MINLLDALYNISQAASLDVQNVTLGNNRANNMGAGLENLVMDAFADSMGETDENIRNQKYSDVFSYKGSKNRPPDFMLHEGAAVEVKKIESINADLQLNSSHPKSKLLSSSQLINRTCRECEPWTEKDFIYTIGHINGSPKRLSSLWFVYGDIYAADESIYTSLKENISEGIRNISGITFSQTNEIGKVKDVDPLKITQLRVRGMWLFQPPYKVFSYVHEYNDESRFQCVAIIPTEKFNTFSANSIERIQNSPDLFTIKDIRVKNPNNIVRLVDCKLIRYEIA